MQEGAFNGLCRSVLVVEDAALIRIMLVQDLEDAGFRVIEAMNADVAMTLIASHPRFDAVVTDVSMPGSIDGLGLARWMRDHAPGVPVLIATAFADLTDVAAINPAIVRVFIKPYRIAEVIDCLRSIGPTVVTRDG